MAHLLAVAVHHVDARHPNRLRHLQRGSEVPAGAVEQRVIVGLQGGREAVCGCGSCGRKPRCAAEEWSSSQQLSAASSVLLTVYRMRRKRSNCRQEAVSGGQLDGRKARSKQGKSLMQHKQAEQSRAYQSGHDLCRLHAGQRTCPRSRLTPKSAGQQVKGQATSVRKHGQKGTPLKQVRAGSTAAKEAVAPT